MRYELTQTPTGRSYIRYLPFSVHAGSSTPYLTIGTYPLAHAYGSRRRPRREGMVTIRIAGGFAF